MRRRFLFNVLCAAEAKAAYGAGHRNVALTPARGMLILDVVDERIAAVEVLYRDEILHRLNEVTP